MSTRTQLRPHTVIDAASMGADITSDVTILNSLRGFVYQAVWSSGSTPVGELSVQVSNDYEKSPNAQEVINAGTWTTISLMLDDGSIATAVPVSGNSGSVAINVSQIFAYAVRLVYTRTSGSATMTAKICGGVF